MYCGKCGNPLNELDKFCRVCGADVSVSGIGEYKKNDYAQRREEGTIGIDDFLQLGQKQEDAVKNFQQKYGDLIAPAKNTYKEDKKDEDKEESKTPEKILVQPEPVKPESDAIPQFPLERKKPKKSIFKKLGIFILVIAIGVGTVVGVGYLWPEIIDFQGMFGMSKEDKDSAKLTDEISKGKKENDVNPGKKTRTIPAEDATEILLGLRHLVPNIEQMRWNSLLKINLQGTYEDPNIAISGQIIDNIWKKDESGTSYYDEGLLKAIAEYESKRSDYINNGDQRVFDYVTPNGPMVEKLKAIAASEPKETVKLLEIGEIRRFENTFYVCGKVTTEIIKETKEHYNIYRLNIVEGLLKVDYVMPYESL